MSIELKQAAQDAAEAIDWLLNNIRRDAPQLSGKAMGNAEKCASALRTAMAQQPATGEPVASRNPFASRCYTMSESHLSGHRLIVGFEKLGDAQDAHEWVARQARGDFAHPAPSVPATGESIGQVFYAADGGDDETGVGSHMKPYVHWFSKALAAAADTKLYTSPVPGVPDSITPPTEDGTEYDYASGYTAGYAAGWNEYRDGIAWLLEAKP